MLKRDPQWQIVTVKDPTLWSRAEGETWMLNPTMRYVINADAATEDLDAQILTRSDLKGGAYYRPLVLERAKLDKAKILVERYRDRGIGDLLFLTGPLSYIYHLSGNTAKLELYALADRSQILQGHPVLAHKTPLVGPTLYDGLQNYRYQWFVESVTEYNEEHDQPNVYDALFQQLGCNPADIEPQWKRPSMVLDNADYEDLSAFYYFIFNERQIDLRRTGYYVVAPLAVSSLRTAAYSHWLDIIQALAAKRPVVVIGQLHERVPVTDMTVGEFSTQLCDMGANVINSLGSVPLRLSAALIARAVCAVTLDSGPLYIAEALRTPAISLWGTHHPGVRLGYDKDYLDLAIWHKDNCDCSPCYAYAGFPEAKCPGGKNQLMCECLKTPTAKDVLAKLDKVEDARKPATK